MEVPARPDAALLMASAVEDRQTLGVGQTSKKRRLWQKRLAVPVIVIAIVIAAMAGRFHAEQVSAAPSL